MGEAADGHPLVVACSVGVDLDLVPTAAESGQLHAPEARLVLAVPARDDQPVTRRIAARLRRAGRDRDPARTTGGPSAVA